MTGGEMTMMGGIGTLAGVFLRHFSEAISRRWKNGSANDGKEAILRNLLREESQKSFEIALGQHVVPALTNHSEKFDKLTQVSGEIRDGINKLVWIEEQHRRTP